MRSAAPEPTSRRMPGYIFTASSEHHPRTSRLRLIFLFGLALAVALTGCGRGSPQATAQRYLDYLQQFNYAACYGMLSEQDKRDRDYGEFLTAIPLAPDTSPLWFRAVLHGTHYILGDTRHLGNRAIVSVKIITPNLPLWERELDAAAPDHIGGEEAERALDTGTYPKLGYGDEIVLVRERHRWRVLAALAARDHLMDQYRKAVALYDQSDFDAAAKAYADLLATADRLDATGIGQLKQTARAELAQTGRIIRERPASDAYIARSLKLTDVAMKMSEDRVPGIFGTIVNSGDRALDQVALAVTWYVGRGKTLRQMFREQHAIVLTPLQFTDFTRPVVPFQSGAARQFGFILTAPAEIQQVASPYVTVSEIAFASPSPPTPATPGVHPNQAIGPGAAPGLRPPSRPSPTSDASPRAAMTTPRVAQ
jgi:hypothetical protein